MVTHRSQIRPAEHIPLRRLGWKHKKPKILFVAAYINQPHGSALSAIDVLRSIPVDCQKYILGESPIPPGDYLHGATRCSYQPPRCSFRPHRVSRLASALLRRIYKPIFRLWISRAGFDLVLVNGFGSYQLWEKIRPIIPDGTIAAVVSRESPRHFVAGDRAHTLDDQKDFLWSFDSHVFVSDRLRKEWTALAGLDDSRTHYLPNCCDEKPLLEISRDAGINSLAREKLGIPQGIPLILNVGTIELRKGQQDLQPLAQALLAETPDFRIACVGFVATEEGAKFRRSIQDSSLSRYFLFPGSSDQMASWYAASSMLAFTSRAEAMPRTVLEAMASALPIVSIDVDGIPELVEHMNEGYLYEPGDISGLIRGVKFMLADPRRAESIGQAARSKYMAAFSRQLHAERMAAVLSKVLQPAAV